MTANPWDKFYWNDWENDPALKLCSLAAQGLWMRMLCICAKADPKGYLLVAGQPLSPADLASLVGKGEGDVETHLSELTSKGVLSLDRKSRIYSRRMVRDVQKAQTARQNGRFGGNPTLGNKTTNSASDNPQVIPPDKPHKPLAKELSNESSDKSTKPAKSRLSYPPTFQAFWDSYPTDSLMSKKAAFAAFQKLSAEDVEDLMSSLAGFRSYCSQHPDYRPVHAVRYITQRRDEGFIAFAKKTAAQVRVEKGTPQWTAWERHYRETRGTTPPLDGKNEGWWFPSEYPPVKQGQAA